MNIPCLYIEEIKTPEMENSSIQIPVVLMHYGLDVGELNGIPYSFTIAICKRQDSGQIIYVHPKSLIVQEG